ncbi:MAG: hypothetical protein PWP04_1826 [Candidatus Atribacteria bacterium]|nr:hypothetical protein [Candidatus Atribacteria bacterium]
MEGQLLKLLNYQVIRFHFDLEERKEVEDGWDVFPQITNCSSSDGSLQGVVELEINFWKKNEKSIRVNMKLEALFGAEYDIPLVEFEKLCRVQGAAQLVPIAQHLVKDFLSQVKGTKE